MRISDWSSDVCSSDLQSTPWANWAYSITTARVSGTSGRGNGAICSNSVLSSAAGPLRSRRTSSPNAALKCHVSRTPRTWRVRSRDQNDGPWTFAGPADVARRSEEHTFELLSLMRNSYAVFSWKEQHK